ncbi:hypothetical protein FSB78_04405 [Sphingomonas ginsenosidivorax]|uniref:Dihydrodipicolinate reductase n=1 Tax=Sphingomonas ginsenosidivorax TaxID=862135 RepID=A0A5C6UC40_9SPHN|nr:hypothetical protein [Sphingomonas ginsenosidivorax]TXC70269.1 hypothetical protein FSB78_04405 [Sphingomonas ginsenosidivorax]
MTYRVIQWVTGVVGRTALKHFIENPVIDLVGVYVTNPAKVGKDAGALVDLPDTGVMATDDVDAIVALDADCVMYAPLVSDVDTICRLLASGKNVASVGGPFSRRHYPDQFARIDAACVAGGASYHACGVHPGFSGDILPLTLTRLMNRIDRIVVTEFIDKIRNPMVYTEMMGFGRDPEALLAQPSRSPEAPNAFAQSMAVVAEGLGKTIERVTTRLEVATATRDIPYSLGVGLPDTGVVRQGTVGGQHYEWTAWADGNPLIVYHFYWSMGEHIQPRWDIDSRYQVVIEGDPGLEVRLTGLPDANGERPFLGLPWTGLLGATAVPAICDAPPRVLTQFDLGIVQPRGLVRPA